MRTRLLIGLVTAAATLAASAPPAGASARTPFGLVCARQAAYWNTRLCTTTTGPGADTRVKSFDGTPIGLNVTLPASDRGDLPLVVISHGWGGPRADITQSAPWAKRGYAVLAIDARGFNDSCGSAQSRRANPAGCAHGWIRLDDPRYELRDIQYLAGLLVDEGFVDPVRIGLYGWSYGGTLSLEGAILRDRVMHLDGSLHPWRSPRGVPMRIAAASPSMAWSDLAYALVPNGRTLDYTITRSDDDLRPDGILKQSIFGALLALGARSGYLPPPGADPNFDPTRWSAALNVDQPLNGSAELRRIERALERRSPYALDDSQTPAPMLLQSGWADDLFPADEVLRYYNRTLIRHPRATLALMFIDYGHPRSQNAPQVEAAYDQHRVYDWFAYYLKGDHRIKPLRGIEAITAVCGQHRGTTYYAPNWMAIHPGEVRYRSATAKRIVSSAGDPTIAAAIDPIVASQVTGKNDCARTTSADEPGTANWRLRTVRGRGYTLLGAPTVIANLTVMGHAAELAARLWDIAPNGLQTLIARGLYRPRGSGRAVFQLHANAWHFAAGHTVKLQLLGRDAPYARPSTTAFTITVRNLDLRLPVHEQPNARQVQAPVPMLVPCGARLALGLRRMTRCAGGFVLADNPAAGPTRRARANEGQR